MSPRTLDRATAQELLRAIMWCSNRAQLRGVARKIRQEWAATPEQRAANEGELARLRAMWQIRHDQMIDPR